MNVLGITGTHSNAAAALAVDGRVVAAVSEDVFVRVPGIGYAQTGGFPSAAAEACLASAGLTAGDLDAVARVRDASVEDATTAPPAFAHVPIRSVEAVRADAVHAAASAGATDRVLVWSTDPPSIAAFVRGRDGAMRAEALAGGDAWLAGVQAVATGLGLDAADSFAALDRLSVGGEPEFATDFERAFHWRPEAGVGVDRDELGRILERAGAAHDGLADAASMNSRVQRARRALAASVTYRVAGLVRDAADGLRGHSSDAPIALGGSLFASSRVNTELRRLAGDGVVMAAVPESSGRALGAALSSGPESAGASSLALGPSFSDNDIKKTLDNCRLDSVYEPDKRKIFARVSKLLAQGKVVAWFQGPMAFGPRSFGTRSVLCDPSGRYARQNVNEYLRQVPLDEPLPVIFAASAVSRCLTSPMAPGAGVFDVAVAPEWREKLVSALDWRQSVRVHASDAPPSSDLAALVEVHSERTGVPGLIETNLCGPGEPVACTPRDAVRVVYSSAIDALVIGGFLLMKDYWLLRAEL